MVRRNWQPVLAAGLALAALLALLPLSQAGASDPLVIEVTESIGVADQSTNTPPTNAVVSETVRITDATSVVPPTSASDAETIHVADTVVVVPPARIVVAEIITVLDTVTPLNHAPLVAVGGPYTADEGSTIVVAGSASDPDGDALTFEWAPPGLFADPGVKSPLLSTADGPATISVTFTATDPHGVRASAATTINVRNVAPSATYGAPGTVTEGSSFTLELTDASDPSATDVASGFTYAFDCGIAYGSFMTASAVTCPTADDGARATRASIRDKDGGVREYTASVPVTNVDPSIGVITAPTSPIAIGSLVVATATFADPGTSDTHTAVFDWGDGTTSAAVIIEASGAGTATGTHAYTAAGVYTLTVTVTDDDGGRSTASFNYLVVFDPNAGFVTGGGWFDSPAGAYAPDPTLTGRASFGFVSRYARGATTPSGRTEFQFRAAELNFRSTEYDWLVVAGARAQYKGRGTVNGSGDYGFLVTAVDGQVNGGKDLDRIRIKIWDRATGVVHYDNQNGQSDGADTTNMLGGGSIVVHH